jgi:hypothetical protein
MSNHHSHTHWQSPQADTQTKACQRVCLSHAENKKIKLPFPSKNFKNANTQTDTKTFEQLVANLNIDKGFETWTTRTPACNSVLPQLAVTCKIEAECSYQNFVQVDSEVLRNRQLRQHANR